MPAESEIALYPPIKAFLERAGFTVKGEVRGCDVVAVGPGDAPLVVVAELKLGLSLELLLQAAERDRDRRAVKLCRLIGFGLLAVTLRTGHVEMLAEPAPYRPRINTRKRRLLLAEFVRRRGDPMSGGSTRVPVMTAYRQQALDVALALLDGPRRPRDIRPIAPDAGKILLRNVYSWFERVAPGLYRLTPEGHAAIQRWPATEGNAATSLAAD